MSFHAMLKRIKGNHQDTSRSQSTMSKATADPETMSVEPIPDEDAALDRTPALGFKPSGVARMEAISAQLTTPLRVIMLSSIFLMSFAYGMDGSVRWSFQAYATSEMQGHAHLAAVNVVRSAIATVAQPTMAKVADTFGRIEVLLFAIFFYIVGTVIEATSVSVAAFAAGGVLQQVGLTTCILIIEIIISDTTSMRSRVLLLYIPAICFLITPWISGAVVAGVLKITTWRWGIGMWGILYLVACFPLLVCLLLLNRRAKKSGILQVSKSPFEMFSGFTLVKVVFWQLDVIGISLLGTIIAFTLVPLTLAGGKASSAQWGEARIVAPITIGVLIIPFFIWWQTKGPYPMFPLHLLTDRAVWAALGIALNLFFSWSIQANFLYSVLIVAFDESPESATRITSLYSFVSVSSGIVVGLFVYRVRRLKPFIIAGTCCFLGSFGLMIKYRGGFDRANHQGIIAAQALLGLGGGLFPYASQVSIQVATKHEHLAIAIGLYLTCFNMGSALGNAVAGAIWTQLLPGQLARYFPGSDISDAWYKSPMEMVARYPVGTRERAGVAESFKYVQRVLAITGAAISVTLVLFALLLRNQPLTDKQSLEESGDEAIEMGLVARREGRGR